MNRVALFGVVSSVFLLTANCSQQGPGTASSSGGSGGATTQTGGASGSGGTSSSGESGGAVGSGGATTGNGGSTTSTGGSGGGATGSGGANSGGATTKSGGAGGSSVSSGGATTSAGGATGSGGVSSSGGSSGSTGSGSGGAGSGGSGAGGGPAKGGATGSGGAGSGGATKTGGTTGAGGATTGSGGATTGSGGATGSGGSTGSVTPADIVPDLAKGFYWEGTCKGTRDPGGHNCPLDDKGSSCPTGSSYDQQGIIRDIVSNVGGTSGQKYTVNIEVRGVIGTRCYQNGTRASTAALSDSGYNNWWYIGGTQYNNSWWNTYELHVSPSTGDASKDVYYFNGSDNPGGSACEREATYLVKYTASFKVLGGGTMTFRLHDSNCQAQQNCGSDTNGSDPCAARTVDLTGMSPQPPASFQQPPTNQLTKTYYPQWLWVTATSVTSP